MSALKKMIWGMFCVLFLFVAVQVHTQQSREEIQIYIPMPTGGTVAQQKYFHESFVMETTAARYLVTNNSKDSDYTLAIRIKPNMITYDDGSTEQAPPGEPQNVLEILLTQTSDGAEIVQLELPFTELEEMHSFNLVLLYQAMANIPLTKTLGIIDDDSWRNKWFYVLLSVDFNVPVFNPDIKEYPLSGKDSAGKTTTSNFPIAPLIPFAPGFTAGMELQFLNWMSAQASLAVVLGNVHENEVKYNHNPAGVFDLSLKFPIKPAKHYMLEPYLGLTLPLALMGSKMPNFGAQGGIQIATKAGSMGAFFINFRGEYDFGTMRTYAPNPPNPNEINWTRFMFGIGAGYKLGFANRNK